MKNGSSTIEWISPEQAEFYESVMKFARTLPDDVRDRERGEIFSRQSWDRCGAFGIQGLPASGSYGGGEADVVTTMLALEALGYGCTDAGLVFSINAHMWTSVVPLSLFGNEQQKQRWLPRAVQRSVDRMSRDHRSPSGLRCVLAHDIGGGGRAAAMC